MQLLSRRTVIKDIFSLGTPIAMMSLISYLASAIGVVMLSHFGVKEVAASALATSTVMTINAMVGASMMSVSIRVSYYRGKKADDATMAMILKSGICLSVLIALFCSVIVWFGPEWLHLFHRNPGLIARTVTYFHISALFLVIMGVSSAWLQFLNGMGKTIIGTFASVIRLPIVLGSMYIFIFGHFGAPQMQLGGLVLSQVIGVTASMVFVFFYTMRLPCFKKLFCTSKLCSSLLKEMKALFQLGWPIGIQYGGELAAITVAIYMIGAFGTDALAAQQIVSQYGLMTVMLAMGVSQAASILIAKVHGEKDLQQAHRIMSMSALLMVMIFTGFLLLVAFFGHSILSVFYNHNMATNQGIQVLAYHLLWVTVLVMFFDALRNLFAFGLRAIGFPQSPMVIGLGCLWLISLPCAYYFGYKVFDGVIALRLGFGIGFVVATIWLWMMWYRKVECRIAQHQG
jgi:putative MATE family efflux protein